MRVLHCPDVVGGHAPQLARAERALGVQAWSVALRPSRYGYAADEILGSAGDGALRAEWRRLALLGRALRSFDVVHFNFGSSLFPCPAGGAPRTLRQRISRASRSLVGMRDLPLLKRAGKAIFVTYQGDDARQGDYCRRNFPVHFAHEADPQYYPEGSDEAKRRAIAKFARYADGTYALNPDLLHVLPAGARFLPYASVDMAAWRPVATRAGDGRLRVVHAPSHRGAKGTRYLLDAVARLRGEGLVLELLLVENRTREAAREIYERADIAVDQLLAGWYGGFAVEAMALGKPVIAYIREEDLRFVSPEMRAELPVIQARPASIYQVLKEWAAAPRERLAEAGASARRYVERWHDPATVALRTKADYEAALRSA